MKCERRLIFVADSYDVVIDCRENFHIVRCLGNIRCTNEGHRNFAEPFQFMNGVEASKLTAVRISADRHGHGLEMNGWIAFNVVGQKDHAGAGGEHRKAGENLIPERIKHAKLTEQLVLDSRFASREHKSVKILLAVCRLTQLDALSAELFKHLFMLYKCSLNSEHCDL